METEWGESKTNLISNNPLVYGATGAAQAIETMIKNGGRRTARRSAGFVECTGARLSHSAGYAVIDEQIEIVPVSLGQLQPATKREVDATIVVCSGRAEAIPTRATDHRAAL